ncbi:AAA family ATPase [Streptomyces sp. NPDC096132]|uniref:AAA family ATPase n=1 Tax=Streptomyces sp. NPDC096132 TaxID=3366075 RepID=UPI00381ED93F
MHTSHRLWNRGATEAGAGTAAPMPLVGREQECGLLNSLLAGLPDRGAALLLPGDPGIGKSALLEHTARRSHARVLQARGVESEAILPYAVLAEVLLPLREHFVELPAPQRRVLEACFGLSEATGPDPYAVCAGALGVLAAAGKAEPLVVLVDDLHWADPSSRQVLHFVARRLESEPVALVMAARTGSDTETAWEGIPQLPLSGLDDDACDELLRQRGLDPGEPESARLVELSLGNPLVLVEYAAVLRDSRHSGPDSWEKTWETPGPLVERAWRGALQALPPETREALAYVAASRSGDIPVLERAFTAVDLPMAALTPAETAGLVLMDPGGGYRLRHPVLRPLVLRGCGPDQRLRVYRALAESSPAGLRAWYLAAVADGPDEEVAGALAAEAAQARRLGAPGSAAEAWYRAAELSPAAHDRAVRLLKAASDSFHSSAPRDAVRWCEQALRWSHDPLLTADIELLRGQACAWLGDPAKAHQLLVAAAEAVRTTDPARAGALYGAATLPAAMAGRVSLAVELAQKCAGLADTARADDRGAVQRQRRPGTVLLGAAQALAGRVREGRELLLRERATLPEARTPELQQLTVQIGEALSWVDEDTAARSVLSDAVDRIRRDGLPGILPYALAGRCEVESWRHWTAARADGVEAVRWARELGQTAMGGYALILLARLDGQRGDRAGCEAHIAAYRGHGGGPGARGLEVFAQGALGSAAFTAGDLDDCVLHQERAFALAQETGLANPNMLTFVADLTEAQVRRGRHDRAAELVAWLDERARATGLAWPEAVAARCRALLATRADEAAEWLAVADRAHARREMVFEHARTQLVHGMVMRRLRRPAAAKAPLLAAHAALTTLGARPWAARAEAELAACGHRTAAEGVRAPAIHLLTAQELQVARTIAQGLSNVEAASALFISRKTVEVHLTRVYRKLGIRSRSDLARTLTRAGLVD